MTLHIYSGFTLERIGSVSLTLNDDGPETDTAVTLSTGSYCHEDISAVVSTYLQFSGTLQTALNAATGGAGTYTVSYAEATMRYTISYSAGNFSVKFENTTAGDLLARVLGYATNTTYSGAATYLAPNRPHYTISATIGGMSNVSDEYEPDDVAWDGVADDASAFGIAKTAVSKYYDFDVPFEPKASVFTYSSTAASWTHQQLFEHARNFEPLYFHDGNYMGVFKLRAEGAAFKPQMISADYDNEWTVPYRLRVLGNLQ